jgi:hypothetical protein
VKELPEAMPEDLKKHIKETEKKGLKFVSHKKLSECFRKAEGYADREW